MSRTYTFYEAPQTQKRFVSRIIKEARLGRDLSPEEAAEQIGVSRATFYRWEAGRIGSVAVLLINWLMHDPTKSHDAFYWRERALLAEDALDALQRRLSTYNRSKSDWLESENGNHDVLIRPRRSGADI